MADRRARVRSRVLFYGAALLWLPAGVAATAALRFGPSSAAAEDWPTAALTASVSLIVAAPCGLPLALAGAHAGRPPLDGPDRRP